MNEIIRALKILETLDFSAVSIVALSGDSVPYIMSTANSAGTMRMASALIEQAEIQKKVEESGDVQD